MNDVKIERLSVGSGGSGSRCRTCGGGGVEGAAPSLRWIAIRGDYKLLAAPTSLSTRIPETLQPFQSLQRRTCSPKPLVP